MSIEESENTEDLILDGMFVPINPDLLDQYSIIVTQEWETQDGVGFTIAILKEGVHIATAENKGDGGANTYHHETSLEDLRDFQSTCKDAYPHNIEPLDACVLWLELRDLVEIL